MAISMLKIRRPLGRLIFNMGITIPGKTIFLIEMAPCLSCMANLTTVNDLPIKGARASAAMVLTLFLQHIFNPGPERLIPKVPVPASKDLAGHCERHNSNPYSSKAEF